LTMSHEKVYVGKKETKESYPTRRRSNVSLRWSINKYEAESDSGGVSAFAKKLKVSDEDFDLNHQQWKFQCNRLEFGSKILFKW